MIKGDLVELHKPKISDMNLLLEWRNDPKHRKYYREHREHNLDDQINWFNNILSKDDTWHHFVVKPIGEDKVIGVVFLNHIHPVYRTGEFGITLGNPNYRGKGFGKDALLTILKYGFNELNLNRIWCEVYSNNESVNLYRKVGFKDEGVLRDHVFKNGKYLDSLMLGMLKSEFKEK
jgi:UDP-4-amino-4,6-dideoxy-N-acetyl-beta-L-altrosamine N-acetyltransferase